MKSHLPRLPHFEVRDQTLHRKFSDRCYDDDDSRNRRHDQNTGTMAVKGNNPILKNRTTQFPTPNEHRPIADNFSQTSARIGSVASACTLTR
jgi:hypothetical protein